MFKKILITLQILLSTLFSGLTIENNITTFKPRLMSNDRVTNQTAIPNTGYVENIYINKYKTTAQTIDILNNSNLNYVLNPMEEQTETRRNDMYVIFCNSNLTKVLVIFRNVYIGNGNFKPEECMIQLIDYTTMMSQLIFINDEVEWNGVPFFSGWQISNPELSINSNLVSTVPNFNIPVGQQNDLLTDLFSIDNVFFDSYSYNEGNENGYQNGYEFGLLTGQQNGEDIGYQNGYIDGQRYGEQLGYNVGYEDGYNEGYDVGKVDGKNNTNPFGGFFEILESATSSMHNFFTIEILPNLTLSTILGIFIALPLFIFFMKLISAK